mmetsp:Transcript_4613/g.10846  ORF Transcript_4613/g.10846 Transcript_4613/m.10846 type:complete len:227 (+) Transcript_4613:58-738(+)
MTDECQVNSSELEASSSWVQVFNTWKLEPESFRSTCLRVSEDDAHSDISTRLSGFGRYTSDDGTLLESEYQGEVCEDMDEAYESCSEGSLDSSCSLWEVEPCSEGSSGSSCSQSEAISIADALELQGKLLGAFEAPDFQDELQQLLREAGGPDAFECLEGRSELCLSAVHAVLPQYGFADTVDGLTQALRVLEALAGECEEVEDGADAIRDSLGMMPLGSEAPWCR